MKRKSFFWLAALAGVIMALPLALGDSYYLNVLVFVGIYSLVTIGLSLLMGYAGQISLGQAAFFGLGAYTSGILTTKFGISPGLALLAAAFLTGGVAFLIGTPALKLRGHYLAMATLAFGYIVYIVFNQARSLTGGPSGFGQIPRFRLGNFLFRTDVHYYYLVWILVIFVLLVSLNITHSRVGRALRSIHGGELTANVMGVNTAKYKIQVFVLSAVYASLAGSVYAHFITFLNPTPFGFHFSIVAVTMVVVGGMTSVWGAIVGAALLTILSEYLRVFHDYDILIYGSILLLLIMFLPQGLFGLIRKVKL